MAASISMGVGLFIYAINFSKFGIMGAAFIGPIPFFSYTLYRVSGIIKNLATVGKIFDKKYSNVVD